MNAAAAAVSEQQHLSKQLQQRCLEHVSVLRLGPCCGDQRALSAGAEGEGAYGHGGRAGDGV